MYATQRAHRRDSEESCFSPTNKDVDWSHKHARLDQNRVKFAPLRRAALAVIQVPTDFNMDSEAALLVREFPGVELRMQKISGLSTDLCTPESFLPARQNIRDAADALSQGGSPDYCSVVGLACTSMSFTLGPDIIDTELQSAHPHALTLDMARSQQKALQTMKCKNIGLVTPYIDVVHNANAAMLESGGDIEVLSSVNLGLVKSEWSSMVDRETLADAVRRTCELADKPLDAVVLGCSAFRVCVPGFISELEETIGTSVVTSTQAFYWNMLRTGGITDHIDGYGRLFKEF